MYLSTNLSTEANLPIPPFTHPAGLCLSTNLSTNLSTVPIHGAYPRCLSTVPIHGAYPQTRVYSKCLSTLPIYAAHPLPWRSISRYCIVCIDVYYNCHVPCMLLTLLARFYYAYVFDPQAAELEP